MPPTCHAIIETFFPVFACNVQAQPGITIEVLNRAGIATQELDPLWNLHPASKFSRVFSSVHCDGQPDPTRWRNTASTPLLSSSHSARMNSKVASASVRSRGRIAPRRVSM